MKILTSSTLQLGGFKAWRTPNYGLQVLPPLNLDRSFLQDLHPLPGWQHRLMQGQGCGQASTPRPEWGDAFLPVLKGPPGPTGFSHLPFLGLVGSPSTVLMLLAGEHSKEVLGCQTSLTGLVPLEEMDLVQTKGIG